MYQKEKNQDKRKNVLLFGSVMILLCIAFLIQACILPRRAARIEIVQNGTVSAVFSMDETETLRVEGADGNYNIVHIEQGTVWVSDADCGNHDCIRQGKISKVGQSIICLPHQMIIRIVGEGETEYDAVSQ